MTLIDAEPGSYTDTTDQAALTEAESIAEPFEGFRSVPYQDPVGIWTIGLGSTHTPNGTPVGPDTPPINLETARAWLRHEMTAALDTITHSVHSPLTAHETAALMDFIYNLGSGNFNHSTLLKALNAGDHATAADEFLKWNMAGGHVLAGLVKRRAAERAEFLKA